MVRNLHTDRDQIDVRMLSEFLGIGKRQRHPVMLRCCLSRILPGCANGADLEVWKRLQGRDMSDRGKSAARAYPYNADADLLLMAISFPFLDRINASD
jgi:hypothetical protein